MTIKLVNLILLFLYKASQFIPKGYYINNLTTVKSILVI